MLQRYASQEEIPQHRFLSMHAKSIKELCKCLLFQGSVILCSGPYVCLAGWQNTKTRSGFLNSLQEEKCLACERCTAENKNIVSGHFVAYLVQSSCWGDLGAKENKIYVS